MEEIAMLPLWITCIVVLPVLAIVFYVVQEQARPVQDQDQGAQAAGHHHRGRRPGRPERAAVTGGLPASPPPGRSQIVI
jgi:hypothetical protein